MADVWLLTARHFTDGLSMVCIRTSDPNRRHERRYVTTWATQCRLAFVQEVEDLTMGRAPISKLERRH